MSRDQIEAMLAGLDGVAPSPWRTVLPNRKDGEPGFVRSGAGENSITVAVLYHEADTRHIARCDPSTIRAVLTELLELRAENERLRTALAWYGEQARLAKLIHAEGDLGRHRLAKDGGDRSRRALERKPE